MNVRMVVDNPLIKEQVKVFGFVEGPIYSDDYLGWDEDKEGSGWIVVALVEDLNGSILEEELIFETFDDAYELVKWFKGQIVPYTVGII